MLFNEKKVVFTRILVSVVVRHGFFHRGRQAPIGVCIQDMQRGCAQANGK
jgi:hypothetical protein